MAEGAVLARRMHPPASIVTSGPTQLPDNLTKQLTRSSILDRGADREINLS